MFALGWRFSYGNCGMFVSAMAPCYPPSSSRYQFDVAQNMCFIIFQPDKLFAKASLEKSKSIRATFARHGQPYESKNNCNDPLI
jgi:hypothetical protein